MARLFNVEVFNQTINNGTNYYSPEEFAALLGSAEVLSTDVYVNAGTTAGSVEVSYQVSNTMESYGWSDAQASSGKFTATAFVAPGAGVAKGHVNIIPDDSFLSFGGGKGTGGFQNQAFGRIVVIFVPDSGDGVATVRVVVCGRSSD